MKTITKVALSAMTLVAVAAGSVAGTLAYLQSQTPVATNVMASGGVEIKQLELQRKEGVAHIKEAVIGDLVPFKQNQVFAPAHPVEGASNPYTAEPTDLFKWGPYVTAEGAGNGLWDDTKLEGAIDKFVFVENTGDSACYYRTLIAFECPEDTEYSQNPDKEFMMNVNGNDRFVWSDEQYITVGGTRYLLMVATYNEPLAAKETSRPSLLQVVMTHNATNEDVEKLNGEYEILVMSQACQTTNFNSADAALNEIFGAADTANATKWFSESLGIVTVSTADELAAAVANGGTVVVSKDINLADTQIKVTKDTTIILAGDIIGEYAGADHYAMFTVANNATLTVEGSGNVKATTESSENNRSLAIFQNSGDLIINGGTYEINDNTVDKTWILATIVDNRTNSKDCTTSLTINGGDFTISGNSINLFRNYPQQGGTATLTVNDGTFHENAGKTTYFWNQESGSYVGAMNFNGGVYDGDIVYEDYNGQDDIYVSAAAIAGGLKPYSGNS